MMKRILPLLLLPMLAHAASPWDGVTLSDCAKLVGLPADGLQKEEIAAQQQCISRGADPGDSILLPEGAQASGSSGFFVGGVGDSKVPPARAGAKPSVSGAVINFTFKFPPWASAEDKPTIPGTAGAGTGSSACPEAADSTGALGESVAISGAGSFNLACGGTMPTTGYPMTLVKNPSGFVATEYGSYYLWIYTKQGNNYQLAGGNPVALPQQLCTYNATDKKMEKSLTLAAPVAQMIEYDANSGYLALRLAEGSSVVATAPPVTPATPPMEDDTVETPESFLVIPLVSGVPQVPADCAKQADYYKSVARTGDLIIEPAMEGGCEGTPEQCAAIGQTTAPVLSSSCETVTVYPSSKSSSTATGADQCTGKVQLMVVDRPNLLHPPGVTATTDSIEGRTAAMANSTEGSALYIASDTGLWLPQSGKAFTFPGGATVQLDNGTQVYMNAPGTINTASGQLQLTGGGELRDGSGNTVANYNPGVAINPTLKFPLQVLQAGKVTLPVGYAVPTQPSPYVRGPASEQ